MDSLGLPYNYCTVLLQYFAMLHNVITHSKDVYEENGNVIGIEYSNDEKKLLLQFEKLEYNEKLDIFSEIVIRYDNETYFKDKITMLTFDSNSNGFEIARRIQNLKK